MRALSILALVGCLLAGCHKLVSDPPPPPAGVAAGSTERDATTNDLAALAGKELHLTKLALDGKEVSLPAGASMATMQIAGEGQVSGRGPVNRYFGSLHLGEHGEMSWVRPLGSTKMASTPARMQLENQFMAALSSAKHLNWTGSGLRFEDADQSNIVEFLLP